MVRQLSEAGYTVVVYDNLSTGFPDALVHGERLVTGDLSDTARLDALFVEYGFSTVLHFAASIIAPEYGHRSAQVLWQQYAKYPEPPRCLREARCRAFHLLQHRVDFWH